MTKARQDEMKIERDKMKPGQDQSKIRKKSGWEVIKTRQDKIKKYIIARRNAL